MDCFCNLKDDKHNKDQSMKILNFLFFGLMFVVKIERNVYGISLLCDDLRFQLQFGFVKFFAYFFLNSYLMTCWMY